MPGHTPSLVSESLWQMPEACTFTRTIPGPGSGTSRSTISNGPLGARTWAARILGMAGILCDAPSPPVAAARSEVNEGDEERGADDRPQDAERVAVHADDERLREVELA